MNSERKALRVCSFESRRAEEMRRLIERHGGEATVVPSMQEIPLDRNPEALSFAEELWAGRIDGIIFMTGVGARTLLEAVEGHYDRADFLSALDHCTTVVRGPKPTAVLREWQVHIDHRAPEPNTWREVLAVIDAEAKVAGRRIAVQEYGLPNWEFYKELQKREAEIRRVPVYRWALPEETGPLEEVVRSTIRGEFDVILITSATQLHHVLQVAESLNVRDEWLSAANRCVIGSIGPTSSETARDAGLSVDMEASHPKMGHLVREALEKGRPS